jgi:hypothetical protein
MSWEYISDNSFPEELRQQYLNTHLWDIHGIAPEVTAMEEDE